MAKILCIEDSPEFTQYLMSILNNHSLTSAKTLGEAFQILNHGRESFDLVLLDISLPDGNGVKALSALKESFPLKFVPFVVISSDDDILTKVAAFGLGADDYIHKPPNSSELKARIEARLRSASLFQKNINQIQIGDLLIDSDQMIVFQKIKSGSARTIELTPSEFKILKLLSSRPGQVYTRDNLIDHVWGLNKHITERSVDAHVSHLRKKIIESQVKIETVLSVGYKASVKDSSEVTEKHS